MQIEISPETEERIRRLVERGEFSDASEAIDEAILRLSETRASYESELSTMLEQGRQDIREGRYQLLTPGLIEDLVSRERIPRK